MSQFIQKGVWISEQIVDFDHSVETKGITRDGFSEAHDPNQQLFTAKIPQLMHKYEASRNVYIDYSEQQHF